MLKTVEVILMVPDMAYKKDRFRPSTHFMIVERDGRCSLPMNRKELYAEAERRDELLDFVEQSMHVERKI